MLILAPIDQIGWRSAVSGVARAISSRLAVRNGPPEAVRMIFSTAPRLPSAIDWKIALCSESTGSSVAPASRTARSITSPAQTSASLLASATELAAPDRRQRGGEAGGAGDRRHRPVRLQRRGVHHRIGPGGGFDAGAGQRVAQLGIGRGIGDHGELGAQRDGLLRQQGRRSGRPPGRAP